MNERKYNSPMECVENIQIVGALYARAKSDHEDADSYRKTVRAIAFLNSTEKTDKAKEADSLRCPKYLEVCAERKQARKDLETYKYELEMAKAKVEVWRSIQATKRQEITATGMTT